MSKVTLLYAYSGEVVLEAEDRIEAARFLAKLRRPHDIQVLDEEQDQFFGDDQEEYGDEWLSRCDFLEEYGIEYDQEPWLEEHV